MKNSIIRMHMQYNYSYDLQTMMYIWIPRPIQYLGRPPDPLRPTPTSHMETAGLDYFNMIRPHSPPETRQILIKDYASAIFYL